MGTDSRLILLALLVGCGGSYGGEWADTGRGYGGGNPYDGTSTEPTDTTPGGEVEDDFLALPPAQTDLYVFIANPARNTVSRVNVETLEVITTSVGADPRVAMVTPDKAQAVIFNRADDSVSVLDVETLDQNVVGVRDDLNQMKLSPDSRYAVLWYDVAAVQPGDPPADGLQSFTEASFVALTTGTHSGMSVGFNPRDVVFTPDGSTAVIVSDGTLAVVDLTASPLEPRLLSLSEALEPPVAEEVILAPDGSFAWVRQFGALELLAVDLQTGDRTAIPLGGNPTDLDLSPDQSTLGLVVRDAEELWTLDPADPTALPHVVTLPTGVGYGSLAWTPGSDGALLYTSASLVARYAAWDRTTDALSEHGLVKPVANIALSPAGDGALVFHTVADAPDAELDDPFFGRPAITVLDLDDHQANPLLLPSVPTGYAMSDDGHYAYFAMEGEKYLESVDFQTLLHTQIALKSVPVYLGVMPDPNIDDADQPIAWVSQEHDLGRISFWDQDASELETITGFELNSGIE